MATAIERNFQVQDCRNEVASDDCCFHTFTRHACVIQLSHFTARQRETGTSAIFPKAIRGAAAEPGLNPASFGEHVEILNKTITTVPSYSRKKRNGGPRRGTGKRRRPRHGHSKAHGMSPLPPSFPCRLPLKEEGT